MNRQRPLRLATAVARAFFVAVCIVWLALWGDYITACYHQSRDVMDLGDARA